MKETRVVTVLTMAVGIGLTRAVRSLIYAVLLASAARQLIKLSRANMPGRRF
jgi:hypothetical protein